MILRRHRLTGERATDISEGNFTFGSYVTRQYAPDILAEQGIRYLIQLNGGKSMLGPQLLAAE